jgi:hypothetical protein
MYITRETLELSVPSPLKVEISVNNVEAMFFLICVLHDRPTDISAYRDRSLIK